LTFSDDKQFVYAAGDLADFGRTTDVDGAIRVVLKSGRPDGFVEFPVTGTIKQMTIVKHDTRFVYFSASNELLTFDIGNQKLTKRIRVYGGFIEATAISPEALHFAITSQNELDGQSVMPCRLSVFARNGIETLSYEFSGENEYRGAVMCFPTDEDLILCLPTGKMLKWAWSMREQRWKSSGAPIAIVKGPFSAIHSSISTNMIFLARKRSLLVIDAKSGKIRLHTDLDVRERAGEIFAEPIECLAFLNKRSLIVAGLNDGRLALVPIPEADK
jgi:hypothetical protein